MSEKVFKLVNIWQSYTRLSRALVRLANTLIKDRKSARNNHVLAGNFAKYSSILKNISLADAAINLPLFGY